VDKPVEIHRAMYEDVNLIQAGYATASFLEVRQASTTNTASLNTLAESWKL